MLKKGFQFGTTLETMLDQGNPASPRACPSPSRHTVPGLPPREHRRPSLSIRSLQGGEVLRCRVLTNYMRGGCNAHGNESLLSSIIVYVPCFFHSIPSGPLISLS